MNASAPTPVLAPAPRAWIPAGAAPPAAGEVVTLIDELLAAQRELSAVERFAQLHDAWKLQPAERYHQALLPARPPNEREQYAFQVDLDVCSGCKSCVTACHALNGLEEQETWRSVGLLHGLVQEQPVQQSVTAACHHCLDPGCLNGCPVLAYEKDPRTGIVRHLDDQCMGCSYCVMKCPYEVPQFSTRLGIVRKCDMCAGRLAAHEAPACAQACPNGAIQITLVERAFIQAEAALAGESCAQPGATAPATGFNPFLSDAPDPRLTLPTTRYLSRYASQPLRAADHDAPRLERAHAPLIALLVFTQAAAGVTVVAAILSCLGLFSRSLEGVAGLLLGCGMISSVLHLGRPAKAWRSFLGWRRSWLSREIIALNGFALLVGAGIAMSFLPQLASLPPGLASTRSVAAALAGLLGVFTSAMVYVDTRRPCWSALITIPNFFGTAAVLGTALASAVLTFDPSRRAVAIGLVPAALLFLGALALWRETRLHLAMARPDSPTHLNARAERERLRWSLPARRIAFGLSMVGWALALRPNSAWTQACIGGAASAAFVGEVLARYVYFAAGAGRRMPGGVSP